MSRQMAGPGQRSIEMGKLSMGKLLASTGMIIGLCFTVLTGAQSAVNGDRALGQHLSSECVTCHQLSGRVVAGVPAIVAMDPESFVAMMDSYRKKERNNQVMQSIAAKFSDDEIAALAVFFASLKKR